MTAAIIWLVLWFLIFAASGVVTFILLASTGFATSGAKEKDRTKTAVIGVILSVLIGGTLAVVGLINTIIQLVTVIQLLIQ